MRRLPQTSGYSYPRVTAIRIDVHPAGEKLDQHDTYASHASPRMTDVRFLGAVPVRGNLSQGADRFGQIPLLLRKRAPDIIYSTPVDRYAGPYPASLPNQPMKQRA
jgi:hypothetical protein